MTVTDLSIPGLRLVEPQVFGDVRGFFVETYSVERYRAAGIADAFVQDNLSSSARGVLRGLHAQNPMPQAKLVGCVQGEVWDVVVDARTGSPTFGRWEGVLLSAENHRQLAIPAGLLHGFVVLSGMALFSYKVSAPYHPAGDFAVRWDDPDLGIAWPLDGITPAVSSKDEAAMRFADLPPERRIAYTDDPNAPL